MITPLREKLNAVCNSVSSLNGRVYYREADQTQEMPYCVFALVTNNNNGDTARRYEENPIQFSLFAEKLSVIEPIADALKTAIESASYSDISGWKLITLRKQFENDFKADDVWQINLQYYFEITRS